MIDKTLLREYLAPFGITADYTACEKLDRYAELLVEWNQKMNLTAITKPEDIVLKHFADSLTALTVLPKQLNLSLIDVGTGAGFPGIPLAILRPDMRLTLLDSLNKRLIFLQEVCAALHIPAQTVHDRAEEGGRQPQLRERFDVATARAVAALPVLAEYCLPFVKPGGCFIAMKGPESDAECRAAAKAVSLLGGNPPQSHTLLLPHQPKDGVEQLERRLFVIKKAKATPPQYPRPSAKIAKTPL